MLSIDVSVTVNKAYEAAAKAGSQIGLEADLKSAKGIEAVRDQVHARLRQVGREVDEQLDQLAAKAWASAAAGVEVPTADVPF